jgi:hypothetical protein
MKSQHGERLVAGLFWLIAAGVFAAGAAHFYKTGITAVQAAYCALSLAGAWLLLLVLEYTLHHARIVFLMVLVVLAALAIQSPAFRVGLGLALGGILAMQARG